MKKADKPPKRKKFRALILVHHCTSPVATWAWFSFGSTSFLIFATEITDCMDPCPITKDPKRKSEDLPLGQPVKKKKRLFATREIDYSWGNVQYSVCSDDPFMTRECALGDDDEDRCVYKRKIRGTSDKLYPCYMCEEFVCKQHKVRLHCCDRVVCKECYDLHFVARRCIKCENEFCEEWTKGCDRCDGGICLPCFGKTKDESEQNCEECWDIMCSAFE